MTSSREQLAAHATTLRSLHRRGNPLVLANIWDVTGARLVEQAGLPAVATSSAAVATSLGYPDDDTMPPEEAFAAVARIARSVPLPVTADMEAGYRLQPPEFARRLIEAGAVGCNLEDTDHHGDSGLVDAAEHSRRLAAIKDAGRTVGVDLVINARIDVFRTRDEVTAEMVDQAVARARSYLAAGADCVYPIGLRDEARIAEFVDRVDAPVNILARGAPPISRLAALGVARVSLASELFHRAYETLEKALITFTSGESTGSSEAK